MPLAPINNEPPQCPPPCPPNCPPDPSLICTPIPVQLNPNNPNLQRIQASATASFLPTQPINSLLFTPPTRPVTPPAQSALPTITPPSSPDSPFILHTALHLRTGGPKMPPKKKSLKIAPIIPAVLPATPNSPSSSDDDVPTPLLLPATTNPMNANPQPKRASQIAPIAPTPNKPKAATPVSPTPPPTPPRSPTPPPAPATPPPHLAPKFPHSPLFNKVSPLLQEITNKPFKMDLPKFEISKEDFSDLFVSSENALTKFEEIKILGHDPMILTNIKKYVVKKGCLAKLSHILFRIWNAIKDIFGLSDWKVARKSVFNSISMLEPMKNNPGKLTDEFMQQLLEKEQRSI